MKKIINLIYICVFSLVMFQNVSAENVIEQNNNDLNYIENSSEENVATSETKYGWQIIDGSTYYFEETTGEMYKGIKEIDGKKYFFGELSGVLKKDMIVRALFDDNDYYVIGTGEIYTGFKEINGNTYYFDENGIMLKGIQEINGKKYFFGELSGVLKKAMIVRALFDDNDYYVTETGEIYTGFKEINGNTYYFDENGIMLKGIQEINGKKYFFGENSGKLYRGWVTSLSKNVYYTNNDGIIQTGDILIDNRWYRFDNNGILQSGFQSINGNTYYYNLDGSIVTGIQKIAGVRYLFDSNGILKASNVKQYIDVSSHQKTIDWDTLWNSGLIDGVILRIGYGSAYNQLDNQFLNYLANIKRLNIPYTIYLYSYAENASEAIMEADNLRNWMVNYGAWPTSALNVYLDVEHYGYNLSTQQYDDIILNFINRMNSYGIGSSVYTYKNLAEKVFSQAVRAYTDWIAHYTDANTVNGNPSIITSYPSWRGWQYTSNGSLPGISGRVDLSVFLR